MKYLVVVILALIGAKSFAQDVHFTQFDKMPLMLNPANAGMGKGYNRASIVYRTQYTTLSNTYNSPGVNIDFPILSEKMRVRNGLLGVGLHVMQDFAGVSKLKHFNAGLSISGIVKLNDQSRISAGLQGSYSQKSYAADKVEWGSQYNGFSYDPTLPSGEFFLGENASFINMSAGVAYKYFSKATTLYGIERSSFDGGFSANNLNRPNQAFFLGETEKLAVRYAGHANALFAFQNRPFAITTKGLFQHQLKRNEFLLGMGVNYYLKSDTKYTGFIKQMYIGGELMYRWNDALAVGVNFKFNDFQVGFTYDITTSQLGPTVNRIGGFEISLKFIDTYGTLFKQGNKHVLNHSGGGNLKF